MNDASDFITVSDVPPSRKINGSSFLEYLSTVSNSEFITENNSLENTNSKKTKPETSTFLERWLSSSQTDEYSKTNSDISKHFTSETNTSKSLIEQHSSQNSDDLDIDDVLFSILSVENDSTTQTTKRVSDDSNDTVPRSPSNTISIMKSNMADSEYDVLAKQKDDGSHTDIGLYSPKSNFSYSTFRSQSTDFIDEEKVHNCSLDTVAYSPNDSLNEFDEKGPIVERDSVLFGEQEDDNRSMNTIPYSPNDSLHDPLEEKQSFEGGSLLLCDQEDDCNSTDTVPYSPNDSLDKFAENDVILSNEHENSCISADTIPYSPNDSLDDPSEKSDIDNSDYDIHNEREDNSISADTVPYSLNDSISDDGIIPHFFNEHSVHDGMTKDEDSLQQINSLVSATIPFSASDTSDLLGALQHSTHDMHHNSTENNSPLFTGLHKGNLDDVNSVNGDEENFFSELFTETTTKNTHGLEEPAKGEMSDSLSYLSGSDFGSGLLLNEDTVIGVVLPVEKTMKPIANDDSRKRRGSLLEANPKERNNGQNGSVGQTSTTLHDFFFNKKHVEIGKETSAPSFTTFGVNDSQDDKKPTKCSNETKVDHVMNTTSTKTL
ncbi:hypothetical protein G6F61_003938 [Rhizopus arrhizus]|nr:hypothetical protein G6F61_003938 [Rhizopus arrhizus]